MRAPAVEERQRRQPRLCPIACVHLGGSGLQHSHGMPGKKQH